jgi:predicted transcriptional regulator
MEIKKMPKNANIFHCEKCNFKCSKKSNYEVHLLTAKHKMEIMEINRKSKKTTKQFQCECGKIYSSNSGLWKHKKKCTYLEKQEEIVEENNDNEPSYKELLIQAIKEMSEIRKDNTEMRKEMISAMLLIGNTTNSI